MISVTPKCQAQTIEAQGRATNEAVPKTLLSIVDIVDFDVPDSDLSSFLNGSSAIDLGK